MSAKQQQVSAGFVEWEDFPGLVGRKFSAPDGICTVTDERTPGGLYIILRGDGRRQGMRPAFVKAALERSEVQAEPKHPRTQPLAPTTEAIDAWRAKQPRNPDGSTDGHGEHYMVDIKTKAGSWRCVTSAVMHRGERYYWTIRGEGSSNGCRETAIPASKITQARAHYLPGSRKS
jgi:hypothetical protein